MTIEPLPERFQIANIPEEKSNYRNRQGYKTDRHKPNDSLYPSDLPSSKLLKLQTQSEFDPSESKYQSVKYRDQDFEDLRPDHLQNRHRTTQASEYIESSHIPGRLSYFPEEIHKDKHYGKMGQSVGLPLQRRKGDQDDVKSGNLLTPKAKHPIKSNILIGETNQKRRKHKTSFSYSNLNGFDNPHHFGKTGDESPKAPLFEWKVPPKHAFLSQMQSSLGDKGVFEDTPRKNLVAVKKQMGNADLYRNTRRKAQSREKAGSRRDSQAKISPVKDSVHQLLANNLINAYEEELEFDQRYFICWYISIIIYL